MSEQELGILLGLLKLALHRADTLMDDLLKNYLQSGHRMIQTMGIRLDLQQYDHQNLVVGHAEWRYRSREKDAPMPPWLQAGIHDLLISQKAVEP